VATARREATTSTPLSGAGRKSRAARRRQQAKVAHLSFNVIVLEALTGIGLSASAGLNAWIPLLALGLLNRYTDLIALPSSWSWLSNGWVLTILAILLAIELIADKAPVVDHFNDAIHTVIRPTAGGLAFGASSGASTVTVKDPGTFFSSHQWVAVVAGIIIALTVHTAKASARPVVNATTAGVGAPVVSTIEDISSTVLSLAAIIFPILVILFFLLFILFVWRMGRRWKRRRARKREEKAARRAAAHVHKAAQDALRHPNPYQTTVRYPHNSSHERTTLRLPASDGTTAQAPRRPGEEDPAWER
jgi:hypothetical protein